MRKIFTIAVAGVLALLLTVAVAKDPLARFSVEKGMKIVTGLDLEMGSLQVGLLKTTVAIEDLRLFNPPGYEDRVMLDAPEIYVDYDLPALFRGRVHLREARIDIREFVVVRNTRGEININSLNVVKDRKEGKRPDPERKAKEPDIRIDALELKIGKVVYKDYSRGVPPRVQEFNIDLNETYSGIDEPDKLVSLIVVRALSKTAISRLTGFDLKGLEDTIRGTLSTAGTLVGKTQDVLVDMGGTARETVERFGNVLRAPFRREE